MNHAQFDHYNPDLDRRMARSKKFLDADKIFYKGGKNYILPPMLLQKLKSLIQYEASKSCNQKTFIHQNS